MTSGVYAITNTITDRVYVGSSIDIEGRWRLHRAQLRSGNHPSLAIRRDCAEYGSEAFTFEVLEETGSDTDTLISAEQRWIDHHRPLAYNSEQPVWRAPIKEKSTPVQGSGRIVVKLYDLLGERRMSVRELQRQTGLSYVTVYNLYAGKSERVDFNTLDQICRALGIQPGDILEHAPDEEASDA